jgi:hypothetical protein
MAIVSVGIDLAKNLFAVDAVNPAVKVRMVPPERATRQAARDDYRAAADAQVAAGAACSSACIRWHLRIICTIHGLDEALHVRFPNVG